MDIPRFLAIAAYALLAIVVAAAVICLAALIGVVKVKAGYQKALFSSIIIASSSMIVAAVRAILMPPSPTVSEELLLSPQPTWDSNYPSRSWRTRYIFERGKDGIALFSGVTSKFRDNEWVPVINWEVPPGSKLIVSGDKMSFAVSQKWTKEAAAINPNLKYEVDKEIPGTMTLSVDIGLRGYWLPQDGARGAWGMMFNKAQP